MHTLNNQRTHVPSNLEHPRSSPDLHRLNPAAE